MCLPYNSTRLPAKTQQSTTIRPCIYPPSLDQPQRDASYGNKEGKSVSKILQFVGVSRSYLKLATFFQISIIRYFFFIHLINSPFLLVFLATFTKRTPFDMLASSFLALTLQPRKILRANNTESATAPPLCLVVPLR